jgi:hypothetical protein
MGFGLGQARHQLGHQGGAGLADLAATGDVARLADAGAVIEGDVDVHAVAAHGIVAAGVASKTSGLPLCAGSRAISRSVFE